MDSLSSWRRFLGELKHRKVYHTGATYAAVVFVVWQAADIAFPALGLPPSFMRFVVLVALLGLPVALALSWALEVIPQRPRTGGSLAVRLWRAAPRPTLLALVAVLVLGTVAWTVLPIHAAPVDEGEWVLLANFRDDTGDADLGGALEEALRLSLTQSPHVNVVPPVRVREALARMRLPEDTPLDEPVAVELAVREGVPVVVVPAVHRTGRRYTLGVRLVVAETGKTAVSRTVRAGSEDEVLRALDELASQLRQDLGESLASLVRRRIRLDRATTASLDALKAWTEANRHFSAGRREEAGTLYRRAVELDSTFALAHADLGQWYYWSAQNPEAGNAHFEAALRHSAGVTERERLMIEGKAAEWRGDREGAIVAYRVVTSLLPRDPYAWGNLAYQYLRLGRYDEAIPAYERVLEIDSMDANAWVNLATVHNARGEHARAVRFYERAFEIQPGLETNAGLNEEYGHNLVALGRLEDAESVYQEMLRGGPGDRARGLRSMALLRMFRGAYREAAELLRQAVVLHEAEGLPVSEMRDRCFLAAALLRRGLRSDALAELQAARRLALENQVETGFLDKPGILAARMGEIEAARQLVDTARARSNDGIWDRTVIRYLEGEIALAEGDHQRAVSALRDALALSPDAQRIPASLARAHLTAGELELAAEELTAVVASSVWTREGQEEWILAHFQLARVLEELGRAEEARARYQTFLGFWGGGDSELPEVREARARLELLDREN